LLVRVAICELLTSRAAIDILIGQVDEVLLAEAAFGLRGRRHRFGQRHGNAVFIAGHDVIAVEVTAIGDDIEVFTVQRRLRLFGHIRQL
jgi:hypothetical protein